MIERVRAAYPETFFVGEVLCGATLDGHGACTGPDLGMAHLQANIAAYTTTTGVAGIPSTFNFPLMLALRHAIGAVDRWVDPAPAYDLLAPVFQWMHDDNLTTALTFPEGNHDFPRIGNLLLRGRTPPEQYWHRIRLAMAFTAAYSGPIQIRKARAGEHGTSPVNR